MAAASESPFQVRAGVRFLSPTSAELTWESSISGPASVALGPTPQLDRVLDSSKTGSLHRVILDQLDPGKPVYYRIAMRHEGRRYFSPLFEVEGRMNFAPPVVAAAKTNPPALAVVVDSLRQRGGYAVVLPPHADAWVPSLAAHTSMTVVAVGQDAADVQRLRRLWYARGIYGIRTTAQLPADVPAGMANLVVGDGATVPEMLGFASPMATIACVTEPDDTAALDWKHGDGIWLAKVAAPTLASWGHQYGTAANTSFSGETLGGADETSELRIRWLGRPGADFGIDRNPRMPAPLAIAGRLFHQGMNRIIALDAFNGAVLWSLELPDLRRVNIPRDCANWCADHERLYAVTRDCLWVIDAASGKMLHTIRLPSTIGDGFDWGYVAVTEDSIIGTAVRAGSAYQEYWSAAAWYDGTGDATTAKVCARQIFVLDKKYGDVRWQRDVDAAVQSTITLSGDRLFFVEAKDPALRRAKSGKLTNRQIWGRASVVCVDLTTGQDRWIGEIPPQPDQQIVAFGLADDDRFVLETSGEGQFEFVSLDADSGVRQWRRQVKWPSDNHGAHMQHAVLMNGRIYIQPHVIDAGDGRILATGTLGKRRGCATPIGAGGSIIYRGGTGPLSLWSLERNQPSEFTRLRPSCWLSTIPAQGMLFSPEAGGGCSCGGWMECSIGFAPRTFSSEASR